MKRIYYIAILLCAAFAVSCSNDMLDEGFGSANEGMLNIAFDIPAATRAYKSGDACDIRFYKYDDSAKSSKTLIRHYYSEKELPETLWLLEGEYCVTISIGNPETAPAATFDGGSIYYGASDFTITAGATTSVNVKCGIRNTMVKIIFDSSLYDKFDEPGTDAVTGIKSRYCATVLINDTWDPDFKAHNLPWLAYKRQEMNETVEDGHEYSRVGYFVLPAGAENISYCFHAFSSDMTIEGDDPDNGNEKVNGQVHIHGTKKLSLPQGQTTREGAMYTLTFKYTPDKNGFISVNFTVEVADVEEIEESFAVNPAPKPTLDGDGFSKNEIHTVTNQTLTYKASYEKSSIKSIKVYVDNSRTAAKTISCETDSEAGGVKIERQEDGHTILLTFSADFLNTLSGGEHTLEFELEPTDGPKSDKIRSKIMMSGTYSLASTDCWNAKGKIGAYVYESASDVKIRYRAVNTQSWNTVSATSAGENIYTAEASNINANTEYEYQLLLNSTAVGAAYKTKIGDGTQIPNSNFEEWSTSGKVVLPYGSEQWWDTGNHAAANYELVGGGNLTTSVKEPRTGSSGQYAARLESKNVAIKFAAGNIFVGKFLGINGGTNGSIAFGKPFDYTYRPKAIKFWYKGTVGSINVVGDSPAGMTLKSGDSDVAELYVCLCQMGGPHVVYTGDKKTLVDITSKTISYNTDPNSKSVNNNMDDGKIVGYGYWDRSRTEIVKTDGNGGTTAPESGDFANQEKWIEVTVPINYNSEDVPNYIMVTASSSKYGDYFTGSSNSVMYLDDVELVY